MARGKKAGWTLLILVIISVLLFAFRKPIIRATLPKVEEVKLAEIVLKNDSAKVQLQMTVRNKGIWHIDLKHVLIRIYDDTTLLLTYANDSMKVLSRNQYKIEEFFLTIPIKPVAARIREHQGEDSVRLRLVAEFTYGTFLGEMTANIEQMISVKVPIPPRLVIREVEYVNRDNGVYNLVLHATLHNQNARALEMTNVAYEMHGEDMIELNGFLSNISIAPLDSTRINIPVKMQLNNQLGIISKIVFDNDIIDYSFVMKGTIVSLTDVVHEFDNEVPVVVTSYGKMELYDKDRKNKPKFVRNKNKRQRKESRKP